MPKPLFTPIRRSCMGPTRSPPARSSGAKASSTPASGASNEKAGSRCVRIGSPPLWSPAPTTAPQWRMCSLDPAPSSAGALGSSPSRRDSLRAMRERLLLFLTILGFVVPNVFVGLYLVDDGFELGGYFSLWTASIPSTQLLVDLLSAALALFLWGAAEGGWGGDTGVGAPPPPPRFWSASASAFPCFS